MTESQHAMVAAIAFAALLSWICGWLSGRAYATTKDTDPLPAHGTFGICVGVLIVVVMLTATARLVMLNL